MKNVFYILIIIITIIPSSISSQSRRAKPEMPIREPGNEKIKSLERHQNPGTITKTREQKIRQKELEKPPVKEINIVEIEKPIIKLKDRYIKPDVEAIFYFEPKPENKIMGLCGGVVIPNHRSSIAEPLTDLEYYNLEIENFPQDTVLYFLRGIVKNKLEDYSGAVEDFSIYLKAFPKDEKAYYQRGLAYLFNLDRNNAFLDFQFSYYLGSEESENILKKYF